MEQLNIIKQIIIIILLVLMNRTRPYLNKYIKQKQLQITDTYHNLNMKEMKPITSKLMEHTDNIIINHSKREKRKQVRQIQIQRENRLLLEKISSTRNKKSTYSKPVANIRTKVHRSLNQIFRRKQEESITQENKRFLARLQNKKPTLNLQKLNRDWKDNQSVIKRMAHYEFYLTTYKSKDNHSLNRSGFNSQRKIRHKIESVKIQKTKVIDGHKMMIKISFEDGFLKITADTLNSKNLKIIDIPKEEAILMVEQDCQGSIQKLIDRIKYDSKNDTLFIVSNTLEEEHQKANPQNQHAQSEKILQINVSNNSQIQNYSIPISLKDKKASIESSQHLDKSKNKSTIKSNKHQQQKVEATSPQIEPQQQQFQQEQQQNPSIKQEHKSIIPNDKSLIQQKELPLQGKPIIIQPEEDENYKEQFIPIKQEHKPSNN